MDVTEVLDALQELLDVLQQIGDARPEDGALQRLVSKGAFAGAKGMKTLGLMLLYKDESQEPASNGHSNGNEVAHP